MFASVDMVKVHVPFREFIAQALSAGELPLWNPGVWLGAPFLANGDAALLYPLQLPFFIAGPAHGVGWVIWLHAALSVMTMYWFARASLHVAPVAAFTAGLLFAFNGYALSHTLYLSTIYLAPWPPLVLLAIERTATARIAWAWLGAPAVALTVLAGNPQEMYWTAAWLPLFCAAVGFAARSWTVLWRGLAALLAAMVGGLALAAVQLLPQVELVAGSSRGGAGFSYAEATLFPLARRVALTLPLPDYLGTFSGENAAWIGLVGSLLAIAGLASIELRRRPWPLVGFFAVVAAGSALFALGAATPLYRVLYSVLPGMHQFRFPVRWLFPASIGLAALAAYGADLVLPQVGFGRRRSSWVVVAVATVMLLTVFSPLGSGLRSAWAAHRLLPVASLIGVTVAAAGVLITQRLGSRAAAAACLVPAGVWLELFGVSQFMEWNHPFPSDYFSRQRPIPAALSTGGNHSADRVLPLAPSTRWQDALDRLGPNTNLLIGVQSAYGNGGNWPAGRSVDLERSAVLPAIADQPAAQRPELWRVLGVTDVVGSVSQPRLSATRGLGRVLIAGHFVLYRLSGSKKVWASCGAVAEPSAAADLDAVLAPQFSSSTLHVEAGAGRGSPLPCGTASIVQLTPNSAEIAATVPTDAWLVYANTYAPGWTATVDGRAARIVPADYFLQSVAIPAGSHVLRFTYLPQSFVTGAWISGAALALWVVSFVLVARRRRRLS